MVKVNIDEIYEEEVSSDKKLGEVVEEMFEKYEHELLQDVVVVYDQDDKGFSLDDEKTLAELGVKELSIRSIIEFGDGSIVGFPKAYREAINMKYNMGLKEYVKAMKPKIEKLWKEGKIITKFGVEEIESYERMYDCKIECQAEHFYVCVYNDLRAALMAIALREIGKGKAKVIGITEDGKERVYE